MCPAKIMLMVMLVILVVLLGFLIYMSRVRAIMAVGRGESKSGGGLENIRYVGELLESFSEMAMKKSYSELVEDERERAHSLILKLVNKLTGLNIVQGKSGGNDENKDKPKEIGIDLAWLYKTGMWKIVIVQCVIRLISMMNQILKMPSEKRGELLSALGRFVPMRGTKEGGIEPITLAAIAIGVTVMGYVITIITSIIAMGIITVVGIITGGVINIVGAATASATGIVFIGAIYAALNMYFKYRVQMKVVENLSEDALVKEGVELAKADLTSDQMYALLTGIFGGSTRLVEKVATGGLDVLNETEKNSIDALATTGKAALSATEAMTAFAPGMGVITGSGIIPEMSDLSHLWAYQGLFVEAFNAIEDRLGTNYTPEVGEKITETVFTPEMNEVLEMAEKTPVGRAFGNRLADLAIIAREAKRQIETAGTLE